MSKYNKGHYDDLYEKVKNFHFKIARGQLDLAIVTQLSNFAMECVQTAEEFKKLKGLAKKDLVLAVITALVEDLLKDPEIVGSGFSNTTRKAILRYLEALPVVIDGVVHFARIYELDKLAKKACRGCRKK